MSTQNENVRFLAKQECPVFTLIYTTLGDGGKAAIRPPNKAVSTDDPAECVVSGQTADAFGVGATLGGAPISSNFKYRRPSVTPFVPSTRSSTTF
jgi:hypothetical protein